MMYSKARTVNRGKSVSFIGINTPASVVKFSIFVLDVKNTIYLFDFYPPKSVKYPLFGVCWVICELTFFKGREKCVNPADVRRVRNAADQSRTASVRAVTKSPPNAPVNRRSKFVQLPGFWCLLSSSLSGRGDCCFKCAFACRCPVLKVLFKSIDTFTFGG